MRIDLNKRINTMPFDQLRLLFSRVFSVAGRWTLQLVKRWMRMIPMRCRPMSMRYVAGVHIYTAVQVTAVQVHHKHDVHVK